MDAPTQQEVGARLAFRADPICISIRIVCGCGCCSRELMRYGLLKSTFGAFAASGVVTSK